MDSIKATLWIYRFACLRAARLLGKNWPVVFAPLVYSILLWIAGRTLGPFGFVGGLLLVLAFDACLSSGLHLIENVVNTGKANLQDAVRGFGAHFWDIVQVSFILWIPLTLASRILGSTPDGALLLLFIQIVLLIFLNAVPELMYQSRLPALELLAASGRFILENWIEWLVPNLLLFAAGYVLVRTVAVASRGLPEPLAMVAVFSAAGCALAYGMIFRGVLFAELNGTNRRSRVYRYKANR
jgi:hypothetical protein